MFGRFHVLTAVDSVAKNMWDTHFCEFLFSALWGLYPGVELLGHMMSLFHFLRNSQTAVQSRLFIFYSLQQSTPVPSLVPSLPTLLLFLNYYFSGYEVNLIVVSLVVNEKKLMTICMSLEKYLCKTVAHFSRFFFFFGFCFGVVRVLIYSGHQILMRFIISKYFLPFNSLSFLLSQ